MRDDYKALSDQLEAIMDHIPGLVYYKDKNNRFIRVNKYVADAYKKTKQELEGVSLYDLYPREQADEYFQDDLVVINTGVARMNIEEPWETPDGLRWVNTSKIPFLDSDGKIIGLIGISMDITERKRSDKLMQELIHRLEIEKDFARESALTDGLTGIANRRYFDDTLIKEFSRLKRNKGFLSLIMLDIDHFKQFNDRYGHLAGDDCLKQVAATIQKAVERAPDFTARYGGEEFVIILPETSQNGASTVAERLLKAVRTLGIPHENSAAGLLTVSLGVVTVHPDRIETPEMIIELADNALYSAKNNGRNRFVVATPPIELIGSGKEEGDGFIRLVWQESDRCGNEIIDGQHQQLFKTSNTILSAIINGTPKDECLLLIEKLIAETVQHFHDEEDILISKNYPLTEEHHRSHDELLDKIKDLLEKFRKNDLTISQIFNTIAFDVVYQHMLVEDKKYFSCI